MKTIRKGVFETNSSSTHSLVIMTKEEYEKWVKGEIKVDYWGSISSDEDDIYTYDEFCDSEYLEIEEYNYKTPSGEELIITAKYGRDG